MSVSSVLSVVYLVLFVISVCILLITTAMYMIPVIAFARMFLQSEDNLKERFVVNPKEPEVTKVNGRLGVIREVNPLEVLVVTRRGGDWVYPVIQQSGHRYTVRGLQEGDSGMSRNSEKDWDILKIDPVVPGASEVFKDLIQPEQGHGIIYRYRKWVNDYLNGMQVVRTYFPFLLSGRVMYEPVTHRFVRARPKGAEFTDTMKYLDRKKEETAPDNLSSVEMVVDTSDHVLVVFPLRFLSETFPVGKSAYSFRADITLSLEVMNLLRLLSFRDWSFQLLAGVNDACAKYFRSGTLESVYALKDGATGDELQKLIKDHVTKPDVKNMGYGRVLTITDAGSREESLGKWGICQALGLHLHNVTLNDLVPADKDTETAVTELMSGVMRGEIAATVAGLLTSKQLEAIKDATPEQLEGMARQTAASQLGSAKHVDWFNFAGGSSSGDSNTALLAALVRAARGDSGGKS